MPGHVYKAGNRTLCLVIVNVIIIILVTLLIINLKSTIHISCFRTFSRCFWIDVFLCVLVVSTVVLDLFTCCST